MKESISNTNPNELSLHFACLVHPNEEYAYYSASSRKLYCAQCLLDDRVIEQNRDLKSIKRSLPIIGQHLQEMASSVESSRGLIGNRKKDAEFKVDDIRVRLQSVKYKAELKFDELAERVLVCKQQFSDGFVQHSASLLDEVKGLSEQFDEKIGYLDAVIEQIDKLRNSEEEEDLLGFYFANQDKISSFLAEDNDQRMMNRIRASCESVESKMRSFIDSELKNQYSEIDEVAKEIFGVKQFRPAPPKHIDAYLVEGRPKLSDVNFSSKTLFNRPSEKNEERGSESVAQDNVSRTPKQTSSFYSKAVPQYFHMGGKFKQEVKTPDLNERCHTTNSFARPMAQSKTQMADTTAYFEILRDRELRQQVTRDVRREPNVIIGNPFSGLEKKLAMFDIRNPARPKSSYLHRGGSPDHSVPPARSDKKQADFSNQYCTHDAPNVESLRFFRQRVRDRFAKDLEGLRRNLFTY